MTKNLPFSIPISQCASLWAPSKSNGAFITNQTKQNDYTLSTEDFNKTTVDENASVV